MASQLPANLNLSVQEGQLVASPSYDLYPGNYSGEVTFSNGYNQSYQIEVPEKFNWTLSSTRLNGSISVGSSGQINTTIELKSNVDPSFSGEVTGNISQYFSIDRFQFVEAGKYRVIVGYGVNEETRFGNYTGELVVRDRGENRTANLTYSFRDNISPRISDVNVDDLMSTKTGDFSVVTSDNLNVSSVCARVWREAEVQRNNKTVLQNQTLQNSPYCFEQESNSDLWRLRFDETEEIGQYYANVTVNDTSGNSDYRFEPFRVEGLDAMQVLNSDFRYEAIWPSSQAEEQVIELTSSTPVTLKLESFRYEGNNTVEPGILEEGSENPVFFSGNDGEITVEDTGTYRLVVDSDEDSQVNVQKEFSGVVNVSTVPQHVDHPAVIRFSGMVNPGDSPEPENGSIGKFDGFIGYSIPERFTEKYSGNATGRVLFVGTVDREECVGFSRWNQCTGFTFGQLESVKQENQRLESRSFWSLLIGGLLGVSGIVFAGLVVRRHAAWSLAAVKPVEAEHHERVFTEDELREFGVIE